MGVHAPAGKRAWLASAVLLLTLNAWLLPSVLATATVSVESLDNAFTGSVFFASANVSSPENVVLLEWDFTGDGAVDVNSTSSFDAGYVYADPRTHLLRLTVTRVINGTSLLEVATKSVEVASGLPTVQIDLPDQAVANVPARFRAIASDPDPSPGGEPFAYRWWLNGAMVEGAFGSEVELTVASAGPHAITVEVTDGEGLRANATEQVHFLAPGIFEGRQGFALLSAAIAIAALAGVLSLAQRQRRERRQAGAERKRSIALASEEAVPLAPAGRTEPAKAAFEAAAVAPQADSSAPRIALGGVPAAVQKTRECPVCHNAIDTGLKDCPYCEAQAEAEAFDSRIEGEEFASVDLSEVRALLRQARAERHLGRIDRHKELLGHAEKLSRELLVQRDEAGQVLARAHEASAEAIRAGRADAMERASPYLKLAESFLAARQYGKVARHAARALELLEARPEGAPLEDAHCPACARPVAAAVAAGAETCPHCGGPLRAPPAAPPEEVPRAELQSRFQAEVHALRVEFAKRGGAPDEAAKALLGEAEKFAKRAEWAEALEVLRGLRERMSREDAAETPSEEGPDAQPGRTSQGESQPPP